MNLSLQVEDLEGEDRFECLTQSSVRRRHCHQGHPHRPLHFSLYPNLPPRVRSQLARTRFQVWGYRYALNDPISIRDPTESIRVVRRDRTVVDGEADGWRTGGEDVQVDTSRGSGSVVMVVMKIYWGDAREKIIEAIDKIPLSLLVIGNRGLGKLKKGLSWARRNCHQFRSVKPVFPAAA